MKVERIEYHSQQRLHAVDLQRDSDYEAKMRALHVVGLHNTWGIVLGLKAQRVGDRLHISRGLAYDCYGRELLLATPLNLSLPTHDAVLVVRYLEPETTPRVRDCTCFEDRAVGLAWRWSDSDAVCPGLEIPLAAITGSSIDLSMRRFVRNFASQQVYEGHIEKSSLAATGTVLHWSVTVSSAAAHFSTVPSYSVQAVEPTREELLQHILSEDILQRLLPYLSGPLLAITAANTDSFTLEARWGFDVQSSNDTLELYRKLLNISDKYSMQQLPIALNWIGVA